MKLPKGRVTLNYDRPPVSERCTSCDGWGAHTSPHGKKGRPGYPVCKACGGTGKRRAQ